MDVPARLRGAHRCAVSCGYRWPCNQTREKLESIGAAAVGGTTKAGRLANACVREPVAAQWRLLVWRAVWTKL